MAHRTLEREAACAAAPVRLDLAGGWTDVPPFSTREGGIVVTAAIGLLARAEAVRRSSGYLLRASEMGAEIELLQHDATVTDPKLILHAAALRLRPPSSPLSLTTGSDVPLGSGLGSSGALDVAIVAALAALDGETLEPMRLAHEAWRLEAVEAAVPGGKQDQYAAALGGFNLITFHDPEVTATPLSLDPAFSAELARRIVLCYTGASRLSGNTITRVMAKYESGNPQVTGALLEMKELALEMSEAMLAGDLARIGALLSRNWQAQQQLDPAMRTPDMAHLESAMRHAGVIGGKASGSGAGGCMFFLAGKDVDSAHAAARASGARILPVEWAMQGVHRC